MASELIRAVKDMMVPHGKSTPYRHTGNAYCERIVRKIVEGARTLLEHAGLPSCFWIFAVRYWCFMDNTEVRDGESAWNLRHGAGHFDKPRLPFGCLVDFLPKPDSVKAMPKFEPRANQGILGVLPESWGEMGEGLYGVPAALLRGVRLQSPA